MNRKLRIEELGRKSVEEYKRTDKIPVIVVLENIRSLNNIGSVFRTADAFGISSIYLVGYTAQPPHRDMNKTAIGATESVDWKYFNDSRSALDSLKKEDYKIVAVEQAEESIPLQKMEWSENEKLALIFGNELTGIEQETIDQSDMSLEIPQFGTKHSLNISVSVGVVLWGILNNAYL